MRRLVETETGRKNQDSSALFVVLVEFFFETLKP
jgi:hypothetical protein